MNCFMALCCLSYGYDFAGSMLTLMDSDDWEDDDW